MSFQPLRNPVSDDVESVSSASNNQLVVPEPPDPRRKAEARRKTLLAISLFSLIVFVASILGYGIFSLNSSTFETEQVSAPGSSSNDKRVSTYAALSGPTNSQSNSQPAKGKNHAQTGDSHIIAPSSRPQIDTHSADVISPGQGQGSISSTPPPTPNEKASGQVSQEIENTEADDVNNYDSHDGVIPSKTKRSRNSNRRRGPPTLPSNPTEKSPISLLYEMGLNPKFEFFVCASNIQHYKTVLTIALNETKTYDGYGLGKRKSKNLAAQLAATDIYKLNYTGMPDEIQRQQLATDCGLTE